MKAKNRKPKKIKSVMFGPNGNPAPGVAMMSGGYDWSWAFVVYRLVPGFSNYVAGSDGTIWSCRMTAKRTNPVWVIKKSKTNNRGYKLVHLIADDGRHYGTQAGSIVLMAFVGPRPQGHHACHFPNRDPTDNRVINLRWGTPAQNYADALVHGTATRGSRHARAKLCEADIPVIRELIRSGLSFNRISKMFGVSSAAISLINSGKNWAFV